MATPLPISIVVKARLVNCDPWTPFCLSSSDARCVDLALALHDEGEDLAGEIAFQGADGVELGVALGDPASDELLGLLVSAQPADGDDVQGAVRGPVAAAGLLLPIAARLEKSDFLRVSRAEVERFVDELIRGAGMVAFIPRGYAQLASERAGFGVSNRFWRGNSARFS